MVLLLQWLQLCLLCAALALPGAAAAASGAAAPAPALVADDVLLYEVMPGDTLISIQRAMLKPGVAWQLLQQVNGVSQPRRLRPGTVLRLPLELLAERPLRAEVLYARGDVRAQAPGQASRPLQGGDELTAGERVMTGAKSSASLLFADGTRVLLRPLSVLLLERSVALGERWADLPSTGAGLPQRRNVVETELQLLKGGADTRVPAAASSASAPRSRLKLRTPVAHLGVRGTVFRTRTGEGLSQLEVVSGRVAAATPAAAVELPVAGGFGTSIRPAGVDEPEKLLGPIPAGPATRTIERLPLQLSWPALAEARGYRAEIWSTDKEPVLLREGFFEGPSAEGFDELPDASYLLRVRPISARGLEGLDAELPFTLNARPVPPLISEPRAGQVLLSETVEFQWARNPEAARYRLQVSRSSDFSDLVFDRSDIEQSSVKLSLPAADYHWRLASVRASGDIGPWSDVRHFKRQRPPPDAPPMPESQPQEQGLLLRWPADTQDLQARYRVQVARESSFVSLVADEHVSQAQWLLPASAPGAYYVRVQTISSAGVPGPFSAVQVVDIIAPRPSPWWWLLPVLLLLL